MTEIFSGRTSFLAYKHMIFPIMRLFPDMTGNEMKSLWRKARQSGVGQTITGEYSANKPPCTMTIKWDNRAPVALVAVDKHLDDGEKNALTALIDSIFCASHCVLILRIEHYLRMQHVVYIETEPFPVRSRN